MNFLQLRSDVSILKNFIYSDDFPDLSLPGFNSVLGSIFHPSLSNPNIFLISGSNKSNQNSIYNLGLLSFKWTNKFFILRLILYIIDFINILFSKKELNNDSSSKIVVWIGSDWSTLFRGFLVCYKFNFLRPSVYIVDDFFDTFSNKFSLFNGMRLKLILYFLNKYSSHFAITRELSVNLYNKTGFKFKALALPYRLDELVHNDINASISTSAPFNANEPHEKVINLVFMGSLVDSVLPVLNKIISCLPLISKRNIILNIISNKIPLEFIDHNMDYTRLGLLKFYKGLSDDDVLRIIGNNLIFVCPYTSNIDSFNLVINSFPSKILKMTSFKEHILLIAPSFSSVYKSHSKFFTTISESHINNFLNNIILNSRKPYQYPDYLARHSLENYLKFTN